MLEALSGLDSYWRSRRRFSVLDWALRRAGIAKAIHVLVDLCHLQDRNFVGIECGWHGDLGPNGSRGSTRSLKKLGRPANKARDHQATWMDDTLSAGACSVRFPYMKGPGAHSISQSRHLREWCPPDSHLLGREVSRVIYRRLKKRPRWIWLTNPLTALALWFLIACDWVRRARVSRGKRPSLWHRRPISHKFRLRIP
ncbi:hypothetical protein ACVWZW_007390 [Bradyrhizobium sp. F1.13.4]